MNLEKTNQFKENLLSNKRMLGLLAWYFIGWLFLIPFVVLIIMELTHTTSDVNLLFFTYLIGVIVAIKLALPLLKGETKFNLGEAFRTILIGIGLLYLINIVVGNLISLLTETNTSSNQEGVQTMFNQNMVLQAIATVIFAPILEELVFRGVIFRGLRKYGFIFAAIVSGGMFGLMHVFSSLIEGNLADFTYIILYALLGMIFSKMYEDTHSIYVPIVGHAFYNGLSVLAMFMLR